MTLPFLTIVVCVHNRTWDAMECVREIENQRDDRAELIVIDSASSEDEGDMLSIAMQAVPAIRFFRVDEAGVSAARNLALAEANGQWLAFVDDDAVPQPGWYAALLRSIAAAPREWAAIGGRVAPRFPPAFERPLPQQWRDYLSIVDGAEAGSQRDGMNIVGANYALRRSAALEIGGFDRTLGRSGANLLSGGDSNMTVRLMRRGYDVRYDPAFSVDHKIGPERLRNAWIRRRVFMEGVSIMRMHRGADLALPRHLHPAKLAASAPILAIMAAMRFRTIEPQLRLMKCLGSLREAFRPHPKRAA